MLFRMIQPLSLQSIKDSVVTGGDSQSTFLLVIQTKAQKALMNKYGNNITLMDGIYRTTNKTLGRALDPRANGTWLSKVTE